MNDTAAAVAKSSGPISVPSGLLPNDNAAAASGDSTSRSGRVESTGPGPPRPAGGVAAAAPGAGAPRPAVNARVTIRGFRQTITGFVLAPGATSLKIRCTVCGPAVEGPPRPRPPRAAIGIGEAARRLDFERLVVERQRALVSGASGGQIAAGEEPAGPGRQELLDLVAARTTFRKRCGDISGRCRQLIPPVDRLAGGIRRCSAC